MRMVSAFMGGFECSTHRRGDGRRLDMIAATAHDRLAERDYRLLRTHGLATVRDGVRWHLIEARPGRYEWSSLDPMLDAAQAAGVEVIWDVLHYGWPDWIDPWSPDFARRFAAFAAAIAARIGPGGRYVAVNEISFLSWIGGEVGAINPHARGRGEALKRILCRAAIAAAHAIRGADADARLFTAEPLIHVHGHDADGLGAAQFDALDTLLGRREPELGGDETLVDTIGLNYYPHNQFTADRATVWRSDPRYHPLRHLLLATARRYGRPMTIAETGCEDAERPDWLAYVAGEVRAARAMGADVGGICLYPILDHPGWDDERHCRNGLFCGFDTARPAHPPLLRELERQQALGLGHDRRPIA